LSDFPRHAEEQVVMRRSYLKNVLPRQASLFQTNCVRLATVLKLYSYGLTNTLSTVQVAMTLTETETLVPRQTLVSITSFDEKRLYCHGKMRKIVQGHVKKTEYFNSGH
jgi:hypothetical protein